MKILFEFMGAHPILTFFLVYMLGNTLVGIARGLGPKRPKCDCKKHKGVIDAEVVE